MYRASKSIFLLIAVFFLNLTGCSTIPVENMIPHDLNLSQQFMLTANLVVADGPKSCTDPGMPTKTVFEEALKRSAPNIHFETDKKQEYTLYVKNVDCCMEIVNTFDAICHAKIFWALRNEKNHHIVWQRFTETTGTSGGAFQSGMKKVKNSRADAAKKNAASP